MSYFSKSCSLIEKCSIDGENIELSLTERERNEEIIKILTDDAALLKVSEHLYASHIFTIGLL